MNYNVFEHPVIPVISQIKREIKHKNFPPDYLEYTFGEMYKRAINNQDDLLYGDTLMLKAHVYGETNHIFIEDERLYALLKESPVKDQFNIDLLIESGLLLRQKDYFYTRALGETKVKDSIITYSMEIHARDAKSAIGVMVLDGRSIEPGKVKMFIARGNDIAALSDQQLLNKGGDEGYVVFKGDKDAMERIQVVHNLCMYLEAYGKESVRDGVPQGQPLRYEEKSGRIISVARGIEEHLREVSPHMRRGYFKRLKSDYFTHKKGQMIYVKATFVRGKAKTVEGGASYG